MASILQNVAIDCADAYELATFWSRVTGRPLHPEGRGQFLLGEVQPIGFRPVPGLEQPSRQP